MSEVNIFTPPPDATLDRIVAANRPRVMARLRRHWWRSASAKRSFSILSGLSLFAAGALVSAAVLVPQLHPGQATFTVHCYDSNNSEVAHFIWGGSDAPANTATRGDSQAAPESSCVTSIEARDGARIVGPVVQSLVASGHMCGNIVTRTGQIYPFQADPKNPQNYNFQPPIGAPVATLPGCPDFHEPVDIPVVGALVACRASATSAAVYQAGDTPAYAVCREHNQPIWSGEGR